METPPTFPRAQRKQRPFPLPLGNRAIKCTLPESNPRGCKQQTSPASALSHSLFFLIQVSVVDRAEDTTRVVSKLDHTH